MTHLEMGTALAEAHRTVSAAAWRRREAQKSENFAAADGYTLIIAEANAEIAALTIFATTPTPLATPEDAAYVTPICAACGHRITAHPLARIPGGRTTCSVAACSCQSFTVDSQRQEDTP